ncbi:MAG: biotin synthase BioB [Candidatus Omnitrophica bacterium]|nr:biotin synthase BioB [Candidatus Omnitrophota bacterium]
MVEEKLLNLPLIELLKRANKIREDCVGKKLELCSILNAKSGICNQDCKFCAQSSKYKTGAPIYPLKEKKEILEAAKRVLDIGAERFGIVTSGKTLTNDEVYKICDAISQIKNKVKIKLCASLGKLDFKSLKLLKEAGLSRYHHNIETSKKFYPRIVTTSNFKERIETIKIAKSVGLEVCSGGIIGMGESWQDRVDMALLLKKLDVDSVPINILVPIKGTPLENKEPISCLDAIKTIAIFRIILKDKIIKIAAGRETLFGDFQGLGFLAGANGMLIGGYLTIKGRSIEADHRLVAEIKRIWRN